MQQQCKDKVVHVYENMLNTKISDKDYDEVRKSERDDNHGGQLKRTKCMVYCMLIMLTLLYLAVIVMMIMMINVPTKQVDDGEWTQWSAWTSCDATCGMGSQLRFRTCMNGVKCVGNVTELSVCHRPVCSSQERMHTLDNYWSLWTPWTSCDVTCGIGIRSRFRTCANIDGHLCVGDDTDMSICRLPACSRQEDLRNNHHASFSARVAGMSKNVNQNRLIIFNEVSNNNMSGYNRWSGIFKAPFSGVYLFAYFIEIDGTYGKVELMVNNRSVSSTTVYGLFTDISIRGSNNDVTFESAKISSRPVTADNLRCVAGKVSVSGSNHNVRIDQAVDTCPYKDGVKATGGNSVVVSVNAGDQVWIQNTHRLRVSVRPYGTSFTGTLLTEE